MVEPVVLSPASLDEIRAAQARIAGSAIRTPLIPLNVEGAPAKIYLKLENLQPIGSFKLRGAGNAIKLADPRSLRHGIWTASAGNMAQAVAWYARQMGVDCTVVVPDHAPAIKLEAIIRLGARPIKVPVARWLEVFRTRQFEGLQGFFVHPFSDMAVMSGNGTIGIEIVEDLPQVDAVIVPYGGGGLACGIACALRALRPATKIFAAEVATAAPLAPSLAAGHPVTVDYVASFVDGIGTPALFPEMWELARRLLDGAIVASLDQIAAAIRLLVERHHIVAEGAGASGVAAALTGGAGGGTIVCVVSGGNIDVRKLTTILEGHTPVG
ncbi:MAG TPA: pyridoxal-phosphate dependent enzyme [bacterium]|nr:pyridoxal-phosphate dependent enzyme [bacterium]